jgi:hypothetical protein
MAEQESTKSTVPDATVEVDEKRSHWAYSVIDEIDWHEGEEDEDEDAILSDADYQLIVDRANAKYKKFMELLRARAPKPFVHDHAKVVDYPIIQGFEMRMYTCWVY